MKISLKRISMNRYKSLIHTFGDRQFTAPVVDEAGPEQVLFKRYESLGSPEKMAEAKQKITQAVLPHTLMIEGIKYVRMDRIAELLIDQL